MTDKIKGTIIGSLIGTAILILTMLLYFRYCKYKCLRCCRLFIKRVRYPHFHDYNNDERAQFENLTFRTKMRLNKLLGKPKFMDVEA